MLWEYNPLIRLKIEFNRTASPGYYVCPDPGCVSPVCAKKAAVSVSSAQDTSSPAGVTLSFTSLSLEVNYIERISVGLFDRKR